MLRRRDDWPARLHTFVRSRLQMPYAYGSNDCCCYVQAAILTMTDVDVMPDVAKPTSRIAAARFLLSGGYGDVEGLATRLLGAPLEYPKLAGRGDVISFEDRGERHLGLVVGQEAATPARDGTVWVPRVMWVHGWRV